MIEKVRKSWSAFDKKNELSLLLVVAGSYGILCYTFFFGLDPTDESWSLSLIRSNRVDIGQPWAFQNILHPVFQTLGGEILNFRFFRLAVTCLLSLFLYRSCHRNSDTKPTIFSFTVVSAGPLITYSFGDRSLSYNVLEAWLIFLAVGFYLRFRLSSKSRWVFLLGVDSLFMFYAKFDSAFLTILFFTIYFSTGGARNIRCLAKYFLGIVIGFAISAITGIPKFNVTKNLFSYIIQLRSNNGIGHPITHTLLAHGYHLFLDMLVLTIAFLCARIISQRFFGKISILRETTKNDLSLLVLLLVIMSTSWRVTWANLGLFCLLSILFTFKAVSRNMAIDARKGTTTDFFVALLLVYIGCVGTNNPIDGQIIYFAPVIFGYLAASLPNRTRGTTRGRSISYVIPTLLVLASSYFVVKNDFFTPLRNPSVLQDSSEIRGKLFSHIKLPMEEALQYQWIQAKARRGEFQQAQVFAINNPLADLAADSSGFASPWIVQLSPASFNSIGWGCRGVTGSRKIEIISSGLQPNSPISSLINEQISACGLRFPRDFSKVAKSDTLDLEIWGSNNN